MDRAALLRRLGDRGGAGRGPVPQRAGRDACLPEPFPPDSGWERVGPHTFRRSFAGTGAPADGGPAGEQQHPGGRLAPEGCAREELLFFDTETTGLSGGAGSHVFLVGFAWLTPGGVEGEQLFLGDFPGEPEFLELIQRRLAQGRIFVSYNGKTFDAHLLRTRFLLNGMRLCLERQIDLLHLVRRFWKHALTDCSLTTVERELLGTERSGDLAGWEVPEVYLEYLRSGRVERLGGVAEHNRRDVLSLVELYGMVDGMLGSGRPQRGSDAVALGGYLLQRGRRQGLQILAEAFRAGDQRAGRLLSLHYKRAGRWEPAREVWEAMCRRRSPFAALELAKYHEHRRADASEALRWVQTLLSWNLPLSGRDRQELAVRRRRLEGKILRAGSS